MARLSSSHLAALGPALAALLVGAATFTTSKRTEALSCAPPQVTVTPAPEVAAPLNARVVVTVPLHAGLVSKLEELPGLPFVLREREEPKRLVPARREDMGAGQQRQGQLTPVGLLPKDTELEVVVKLPRPADAATRFGPFAAGGEVVVGSFRTGNDEDRAAPVWNGVTRATIAPKKPGHWGPSGPTATFHFAAAGDESTPNEQLRFGVWLPDARGRFDYSRPPTTYASAHGRGEFFLTGGSPCGWATFAFPIVGRIGVRVLDLAGNMGPPSEVRLVAAAR